MPNKKETTQESEEYFLAATRVMMLAYQKALCGLEKLPRRDHDRARAVLKLTVAMLNARATEPPLRY